MSRRRQAKHAGQVTVTPAGDALARAREKLVFCRCGAVLNFNVRDPQLLGRTMQQCSDPACSEHVPRPTPCRFAAFADRGRS